MADLIQEQATTYTPGENDLVYNTVVTMGSYSSPQPVVIKQYDSLPIIAAKMRKDGNDYQVPDGAAVNIRLHKRSGTFIYSSVKGISQDRKTAYIQLTSNMTAVYGRTMPCLEIVVNGSVACTGDMVWDIQRNPVQEDDVKDTSEGQYIQEMAAQVQAFEDTYQEALDYMNNATNQSQINNAASNAQAAQQAATNAANSADEAEEEANRAATESAKALGFRSFHGGQIVPGATDGDLDPSRPMSTPTAASVTIKARGDRIAGLTMAGKTTQAGTGDPSPENIRMISGVGMYDRCIVLDGASDETWRAFEGYPGVFCHDFSPQADNADYIKTNSKKYNPSTDISTLKIGGFTTQKPGNATRFILRYNSSSTNPQDIKGYLSAHPLTVWYHSVDYAKSTGPFYTVVELSDDPYRAVGFELNAPLFDGDSLEIGGLSGFDQMIVLDGSEDETWGQQTNENGFYNYQHSYINYGYPSGDIDLPAAADTFVRSNDHVSVAKANRENKTFYLSSNFIYLRSTELSSVSALRSYLQSHPLTVFYKSVNYTPENDIAVALERHEHYMQIVQDVQGSPISSDEDHFRYYIDAPNAATADTSNRTALSSHYSLVTQGGTDQKLTGFTVISNKIWIYDNGETAEEFNVYLQAQINAGTPVQVVYKLATPVSYARPVPTMIAQPGEDGTFTVTGENSLSVLLKPFQDGGNAARLDGHTWDDIMAAIDQKIANLASTAMEVN